MWPGWAWRVAAIVADGSTEPCKRLSAALYEEWLWNGALRSGKVWRGKIRFGLAWLIAADGSTGAFGLLCCSRKGVVMVRSRQVR